MKHIFTVWSVVLLLSLSANSQEKAQTQASGSMQWNYPNKEVDRLLISVKKASVEFKGSTESQADTLQIQGLASDFQPVIEARTLKIEALDKNLNIHISGNWKKVEFVAESLKLDLKKSASIVSVKSSELQLHSMEHGNNLEIACRSGKVLLNDTKGNITIENQSASLQIKGGEGELKVRSFAGRHSLEAWQGGIQIHAQNGEWKVDEGRGDLVFKSQLADLKMASRVGQFKLSSVSGDLRIQMPEDAKLRASTEDGSVQVKMPSVSGAHVNIGSKEGDMNFPRYLELKRYPQMKIATGRLRGRLAGSVFVRTDKGRIDLN